MQKYLCLILALLVSTLFMHPALAQNGTPYWSTLGNSNATSSSKFGTTNAINLRLFTNNVERMRITTTGLVGIGTISPTERLQVNSAADANPFRAQVNGATKFLVHRYGGVAVGANVIPPSNGLSVSGNVGIGTSTPANSIDIINAKNNYGIGIKNTAVGNVDQVGVYAVSINNPGYGYGVYGVGGFMGVSGTAQGGGYLGNATGIRGEAYGSAGYRYGVFGTASGGTFNASGYFSGAVYAVSYNNISDRKFKEGIAPLEKALEQVLKLKPSAYQFKTEAYKNMGLPKEKQIGLIADEVREVFPELVTQAVHPPEYDKKDRTKVLTPEVAYESVNYIGLIPVLIASIQEQQQLIEEKDKRIAVLETGMAELRQMVLELKNAGGGTLTSASGYLEQNTPNPVSGTTVIRYKIPETSTSARLSITNSKGQLVKTISIRNRGAGQINLNTQALAAGTYNYTLYVDGKQTEIKRLIIIR